VTLNGKALNVNQQIQYTMWISIFRNLIERDGEREEKNKWHTIIRI